MSTPHKCPVCDGTGKVSRPPHIAGDQKSWMDSSSGPYDCQPCLGTGVLWELDFSDPPVRIAPHETMISPWPKTGGSPFEHVVPATFSYDIHAA